MAWLDTLARKIAAAVRESDNEDAESVADLKRETADLREEIETLTIEKGRREEEFSRREREVEHKVGLERKRQEFELDAAKREAVVTVREENLKADKQRFEDAMTAQQERLDDMKELLGEMMKRLPSANIEITETRNRGSRKAS